MGSKMRPNQTLKTATLLLVKKQTINFIDWVECDIFYHT